MEEQYGQTQTYGQNQMYGQQQPYQQQNQMYGQTQAYGQNQPNQAYVQYQPYQQQNPYYAQPARAVVYNTMPAGTNNSAIGGLVIGIFAIIGCWIPIMNILLAMLGIVFSAVALGKKSSSHAIAVGGLITSIIAFVLGIVMMCLFVSIL